MEIRRDGTGEFLVAVERTYEPWPRRTRISWLMGIQEAAMGVIHGFFFDILS